MFGTPRAPSPCVVVPVFPVHGHVCQQPSAVFPSSFQQRALRAALLTAMGRLPGNGNRAEVRSLGDNVLPGPRVRERTQARKPALRAPVLVLQLLSRAREVTPIGALLGEDLFLYALSVV